MSDEKLVGWVNEKLDLWRSHRDDNYLTKWDEYERIWRGVWSGSDKQRESERSRIISPATQQAIESHTSEIEEALWGTGADLFDIRDDIGDQDPTDIESVKAYMKQCFKKNKLRKNVSDILLLGSIYGTGIGELVLSEEFEYVPDTQPIAESDASMVGVTKKEYVSVVLRPINPRNFIIDPSATSIEEAMGCAVEEYMGAHIIAKGMEDGVYFTKDLSPEHDDLSLESSSIDQPAQDGRVKILRYYGLVPLKLLDDLEEEKDELEKEFEDEGNALLEEYGELVEAIIVIGNGSVLLKAEKTPYMMKDRPMVAYQDDTSPNRFWGRGIAEKGYNMQKAIDAQLRSHMDSLALTTVPMMGMDATRLPRGSKFEVKPGKSVLTNGNPSEILMPFKFGQTDPANIETAGKFEGMLLQATGTLDTSNMQGQVAGGELSVTLSGIIKKNKRTLVNFQESFLIPFIEKAAWRFMQFDPDHFPVKDFKFVPMGTLGMLAREVEQLQFINLLKTLGTDNAIMPMLLQGVIENSALPNKEVLLKQLQQSMQQTPEQEQRQQMAMQMELQTAQAELGKLVSEVEVNKALATKYIIEAKSKPEEVRAKMIAAASTNLPNDDDKVGAEFDRRVKIAELMLKEADMDNNAKIVQQQMTQTVKEGSNG